MRSIEAVPRSGSEPETARTQRQHGQAIRGNLADLPLPRSPTARRPAGSPGSEIELMELGVIRAGALDGLKARLLLTPCQAAAIPSDGIPAAFARVAMTTGPVTAGR